MTDELRRSVKERLIQERSLEFEPRMRMLIPAQYPKVWGEQRVGNKIDLVAEVAGAVTGLIMEEMRGICLCISTCIS